MNASQTAAFDGALTPRRVFIVFSTRDLPYASVCIQGLLANAIEPVILHLIVDDTDEVAEMNAALVPMQVREAHEVKVIAKSDIDPIAATRFADYPNLLAFREGHPCWRKITDPYLLSEPGEEIIVLDPDLFFPNPFAFEPAPETDILLMHQGPNCLFPPRAVERAFDAQISMADHVDIGALYTPTSAFDLPWMDKLLGDLGVMEFKKYMHIEAIVWSAMCMHTGGAYLDSSAWRCWQKGYVKRLLLAVGFSGKRLLKLEPLAGLKCLHVSGPSKYWVVEALGEGSLTYTDNLQAKPTPNRPVIPFPRSKFDRLQRMKKVLYGAVGKSPPS